jgi:hypothetical protein
MRPLLLDDSALEALFCGHDAVTALWFGAEARGTAILLPTTAIAEANRRLDATDNAWDAVLLGPNVVALELSTAAALGTSRLPPGLATAHASYEAIATNATIITNDPERYDERLRMVVFGPN